MVREPFFFVNHNSVALPVAVAFLFNWIGLLVSVCVTQTVAGRFGAISGFGLSMVKWVAIVKVSQAVGQIYVVPVQQLFNYDCLLRKLV